MFLDACVIRGCSKKHGKILAHRDLTEHIQTGTARNRVRHCHLHDGVDEVPKPFAQSLAKYFFKVGRK